MRKFLTISAVVLTASLFLSVLCFGEVITRLPTNEKVVSLTFDACETRTPSYLDKSILNYLLGEHIPFTIFVSGKFAARNSSELSELSKNELASIENHSLTHPSHMERLNSGGISKEVMDNQNLIERISGRRPVFFRFPAGNCDNRSVKTVEELGYRVVHWTFPSGDPARNVTADKMYQWVLSKVKPGSILIFHINGRGYHTGEALPRIVRELKRLGYRFVKLEDYLL
jgi:peptidoglycan/xylan/chitin deacetylase (PgdA/CDA1 family)